MTDTSNIRAMVCMKCSKEYPKGTTGTCPADSGELVPVLADPIIGTLFADKYEILSLLGEGGMSKVYKARHKFMERVVAVKLLHEHTTSDPTAAARFQQEAKAASLLNHQNVVTVHDFGFTPSNQAFFVMDCLEGKSLSELLEEHGSLPLEQAIEIFTQGCDGLDHAHRKGIVHRDIKPSNLVIIKQEDGSDLVKLVDFGIAKVMSTNTPTLDPVKAEQAKALKQLTQTGEIFGTPAYMSPEQCNGRTLDARSDIYSFGCMMYEALAGEPPLLGDSFITTVVKHINEQPKKLSETAPHREIPLPIEAVIMKCLEKDPADRYPSTLELKQALFDGAYASGLKGLRVGAVPEPRHGSSQPVRDQSHSGVARSDKHTAKKSRLPLYASLILVAGLVGAGNWIFLNHGPDDDSGTPFQKILWQSQMQQAEDLYSQKKYQEAEKVLQQSLQLAKQMGDDGRRLEGTLNRLVDVYTQTNDIKNLVSANKMLKSLADEKVHQEYQTLRALMLTWKPSTSETQKLETQSRALAFSDRILRCADKMASRNREKQEVLLRRAIDAYEQLDLKSSLTNIKLRVALAECYRTQQRYRDMRPLLEETTKLMPTDPGDNMDAWKAIIHGHFLLAQIERNESLNEKDLRKAKEHISWCLENTRKHLPTDKDQLRDCLNGMAVLLHMLHEDKEATKLEQEALKLETNLDAEAERDMDKPDNT